MEIIRLMDELEEVLDKSRRIPLTSKVVIDEDIILDYLDRIRALLPEEIRQAKWIAKERERLLEEAAREKERLIEDARNYIARMADESEVAKKAQAFSEEIVQQAKKVAREIKNGANEYADELLRCVENTLEKNIIGIRKGREELRAYRQGKSNEATDA